MEERNTDAPSVDSSDEKMGPKRTAKEVKSDKDFLKSIFIACTNHQKGIPTAYKKLVKDNGDIIFKPWVFHKRYSNVVSVIKDPPGPPLWRKQEHFLDEEERFKYTSARRMLTCLVDVVKRRLSDRLTGSSAKKTAPDCITLLYQMVNAQTHFTFKKKAKTSLGHLMDELVRRIVRNNSQLYDMLPHANTFKSEEEKYHYMCFLKYVDQAKTDEYILVPFSPLNQKMDDPMTVWKQKWYFIKVKDIFTNDHNALISDLLSVCVEGFLFTN